MLENSSLKLLKESKNLLAFSAGVDSTALLFLLLENNIKFDIAIVNYGVRLQSEDEVAYAQKLASKYNFKCHLLKAKKIDSNFEAKARNLRYDFFEELIKKHNYQNLLTAHHLGDRFEWMLMQFCKGAGCVEISGMKKLDKRQNYNLLRPLLHLDKQELLKYLEDNQLKYFLDESNLDESYKRNEFRHNYSTPLLHKYLSGIKKSFEYIDEDVKSLVKDIKIKSINDFNYFKSSGSKRSDILAIDRYLKSKLHLTTASEKELLKKDKTVIISRRFVVNQEHGYVFIAPYIKAKELSKELKEKLRLLCIEPKLRGYLATDSEAVVLLSSLELE
ncbi:tRNA lysidine(34) synthetase TilS [Sulfurimonas aquatica]|uniref:tRNA(Ile)-lysidine synthase n=1 Tax=Sulfurimonas aquatica TaxID=2672570 RepID=A0A975B1W8_9BACT|nr:tRNA lysidine(34) synthetase TilS [Sulfurimonas aquatica]QSZ42628.1 tRNA lysidine(34) synthetase TilS [Sulfurimonas aquatica]